MRLTLTLLLFALSGQAQWVSPQPQTYESFSVPAFGSEPVTAVAGNRVLLAWTQQDFQSGIARTHIRLLDSEGKPQASIGKLEPFTAGAPMIWPSVASDGTGFYVVWYEAAGRPLLAGIALDADGKPIGSPRLLASSVPTDFRPRVSWEGRAYVTGTPAFPANVDSTGLPAAGLPVPFIPSGFRYAYRGTLVGVAAINQPQIVHCGFSWCTSTPPQFILSWTMFRVPVGATTARVWIRQTGEETVVAGDDRDAAVVFRLDKVMNVLFLRDSRERLTFAIPDAASYDFRSAAIAFDGERWLVVLAAKDNRLRGMFFNRDGGSGPLFVIDGGSDTSASPSVVATQPGRFLVVYDLVSVDGHRLASRVVTPSAPGRRRALGGESH